MEFFKVIGIIYTHTCFKQGMLNVFLKLLSEPHCVRSGMCPLILPLSSWRKPERERSSGGSPSGLTKIQSATFFPSHSNTQTAGEFLWCSLCWNMINDTESLTVPCIALCISIFPHACDVEYINHYYFWITSQWLGCSHFKITTQRLFNHWE